MASVARMKPKVQRSWILAGFLIRAKAMSVVTDSWARTFWKRKVMRPGSMQ